MAIITGAHQYFNRAQRYYRANKLQGFLEYNKRKGISVSGNINPKSLSYTYFARQLYYRLHNYISKNQSPTALSPVIIADLALAMGPEKKFGANAMKMTMTSVDGTDRRDTPSENADRIFEVVSADKTRFYPIEEIIRRYNNRFDTLIADGKISRLNGNACEIGIDILRERGQIEIRKNEGIRYFDQAAVIGEVTNKIRNELVGVSALIDLVRIVSKHSEILGENIDLYLFSEEEDGDNLLRVGLEELPYTSSYEEWTKLEAKGMWDRIINQAEVEDFIYVQDIESEPNISDKDRQKYRNAFGNPREIRYSSKRDESQKRVMATKRYTWEISGSERGNRVFYSPNCGRKEIDAAYDSLDQVIASSIGRILDLPRNRGKRLREIWQREIAERKRYAEKTPPDISAARIIAEPRLFRLVSNSQKMTRFGKTIQTATIYNPSTLSAEDQNIILEALSWAKRPDEDMLDHVINVAELDLVFHNGKPVAFASCKEVNHRNDGKSERMLYLTGTMVKPEFRGRGLSIIANTMALLRRWWRWKFEQGFFKPLRPMMRSRSVPTILSFWRFFSKVKFFNLKGRDKQRADTFAKSLGCACDDNGVVRGAHDMPVYDAQRDAEIHRKLKGKRKEVIDKALEELGENDSRIFQATFNVWSAIKFLFFMRVIFKRINRKFEKQETKKDSGKKKIPKKSSSSVI